MQSTSQFRPGTIFKYSTTWAGGYCTGQSGLGGQIQCLVSGKKWGLSTYYVLGTVFKE